MSTKTTTSTMSDELIQDNVHAELQWDARVRPTEIGIAVKDGVVTLAGTVDSNTNRWAADNLAEQMHAHMSELSVQALRDPLTRLQAPDVS